MEPLDTVVRRLAVLEKENARLKRVQRLLCTFALSIGVLVLFVAASVQKSMEIADVNGTLRAVLFAADSSGKSGLEIRGPGGKARLAVYTNHSSYSYMNFIGVQHNPRAQP